MPRRPARLKRRTAQTASAPSRRPGVEARKSLAKALGPQGARAIKEARKAASSGAHGRAAKIYGELAERLEGEGKTLLASRALLHCARNLHRADNEDKARDVAQKAVELAAASPNRKAAVAHIRNMVDRLNARGRTGLAEGLENAARKAFQRGSLRRKPRNRRG